MHQYAKYNLVQFDFKRLLFKTINNIVVHTLSINMEMHIIPVFNL